MKKIILSVALVFGCLTFANAQQNALGLKFGDVGNNAEISFQRMLTESNRLELNLNVGNFDNLFDWVGISGLYQWVWNLDQLAPGFRWFAGVGAGVSYLTVSMPEGAEIDRFSAAAFGNIGIEYNFSFPLQLALDYTPSMSITPSFGNFFFNENGIRLAARWRF